MKEPLKVGDEFRTSLLSKYPGGVTVVLEFAPDEKGFIKILEYDKVKFPKGFIAKAKVNNDNIVKAWIKE
jgi:hypothetical protein